MHYLEQQHPVGFVPLKQYCKEHPELLPESTARKYIANLEKQHEAVRRIFRKRFGRWHVHVPSHVAYLEIEEPIIAEYGGPGAAA